MWVVLWCVGVAAGCGDKKKGEAPRGGAYGSAGSKPVGAESATGRQGRTWSKRVLLVTSSQFAVEGGKATAKTEPARLDVLSNGGGSWWSETVRDADSNVFHKALPMKNAKGEPGVVTLGGSKALIKFWKYRKGRWDSNTWWEGSFGGSFNRMRDAELGDLLGTGTPVLAVGTHDQGVMALVSPKAKGEAQVTVLDRKPNTFIHEVEVGDLNGDGVMEAYTTPSEPNRLGADVQKGAVVRYVPKVGKRGEVVAELGNRHAKEILVADVDGDGRQELYVAVEAKTRGKGASLTVEEPVEIRRYGADTDPKAGVVIGRLPGERFCRFLTSGNVHGQDKRVLVAAAFSTGVWILSPGKNPDGQWSVSNVDRDSGSFEHAALLTDLDQDGKDELYVASDKHGEIRRYVWHGGKPRREVIYRWSPPASRLTWNLVAAPSAHVR